MICASTHMVWLWAVTRTVNLLLPILPLCNMTLKENQLTVSGIIQGMGSATERKRYYVTLSLIGCAHTQKENQPTVALSSWQLYPMCTKMLFLTQWKYSVAQLQQGYFLQINYNRHLLVYEWGQEMGCLLWAEYSYLWKVSTVCAFHLALIGAGASLETMLSNIDHRTMT